MVPIKHMFHINSPIEDVFKALNDIDSLKDWYTSDVEGGKHLSDRITFKYGDMKMDVQITELLSNRRVQWTCIENESPFEHHVFTFDLDMNVEKTRVRFTHNGFMTQDDNYANLNYSWGKYLESLRQFCQTGKGEAFGSKRYRS